MEKIPKSGLNNITVRFLKMSKGPFNVGLCSIVDLQLNLR